LRRRLMAGCKVSGSAIEVPVFSGGFPLKIIPPEINGGGGCPEVGGISLRASGPVGLRRNRNGQGSSSCPISRDPSQNKTILCCVQRISASRELLHAC
jgi:hypothetical protein